MRQSFRKSDVIARFGGDEYNVLAVTELGVGDHLMGRLKAITDRKSQEFQKAYGCGVSFSVGMFLAEPQEGVSVDALLESALAKADELMYQAKTGGKNRMKQEVFDQQSEGGFASTNS